ncbi:MAG TPA: hypothetical protein VGB18_01330, partial [Candidatus Thermoplasmatota archaeon]
MNPGQLLNLAAGIVFVTVGLAVVAMKPRHPPAISLAAFAIGAGTFYIFFQPFAAPAFGAPDVVVWLALLVWGSGAFGMAFLVPRRLQRREARHAVAALLVAIVLSIVYTSRLAQDPGFFTYSGSAERYRPVLLALYFVLETAFMFQLLIFPLRARLLAANEASHARSFGILSIGICFLSAATVYAVRNPPPGEWIQPAIDILFVTLAPALWLLSTRRPHART